MKPTIISNLPEADILLYRKARKIFVEFPDEMQLGNDEEGRPVILTAHVFARGVGKALGLRVVDGCFDSLRPHSWLVTPTKNIIDVLPVGVLTSPMLVQETGDWRSMAKALYTPRTLALGFTKKAFLRRAVNIVARRAKSILEWSRFDRLPPKPKENDPRPLAEQFSMLPFASQADEWLKLIETKDIFWQLENRRIHSFSFARILSTAGVGFEVGGGLCVTWNTHCDLRHCFESLGHEISHTFHYDLTKTPPVEIVNQQSHEFMYDFDAQQQPHGFYIEDFCDAFSMKWMAINSKERIAQECKNENSLLGPIIQLFSEASDRTLTP